MQVLGKVTLALVTLGILGSAPRLVGARRFQGVEPDPAPTTQHAGHSPTTQQKDRPAPRTVEIEAVAFTPTDITVKVGETVTWVNKDPFPHNVTSTDQAFKSSDLAPDQRWQFRAAKAGRFPYVCTLHPGMKGTLVVKQ